MSLSKLQIAAANYNEALHEIEIKRFDWARASGHILNTLRGLVSEVNLPITVEMPAEFSNHGCVVARFHDEEDLYKLDLVEERPIKKGGQLVFQQMKNGNILIVTIKPRIEGIGINETAWYDDSPEYTPAEINPQVILESLLKFIETMTAWEQSRDDPFWRIGFRQQHKDESE